MKKQATIFLHFDEKWVAFDKNDGELWTLVSEYRMRSCSNTR